MDQNIDEVIDRAVARATEGFRKEIGSFYVDRELHYQDHMFLREFRCWVEGIKNNTWKTIVGVFVTALFGLLVIGFIVWGKSHMK